MKKISIILLMLLITSQIYSQKLSYRIELEKSQYLLKEKIPMLITIQNLTNEPIEYNFNVNINSFDIQLIDENGKIHKKRFDITDFRVRNSILDGGEIEYSYYNLIPYKLITNSLEIKSNKQSLSNGYIEPGKYTLKSFYDFGGDVGITESNILQFEVKKPQTDEQILQLKKLDYLLQNLKKFSFEEYQMKIEEIISISPKSPYSIRAKSNLIRKLKIKGKKDEARQLMEATVVEHPESFDALSYIISYDDVMEKVLKKDAVKNTRVKEYGEKIRLSKQKIKKVK